MESTLKVYDLQRKESGSETLPASVFGVEVNKTLLHEAVRHYLAAGRSGTADTKNRAEVSGSGRKLWKQKKTGRARIGSIRSPLWRHGGTVHGPTPRSYAYHFPRKKRAGALRSALSAKVAEDRFIIVKDFDLASHKTGELAKVLETLKVGSGALLVDEPLGRNLELAARNLPRVKVLRASNVNVMDLIKYDHVVVTAAAVRQMAEVLAP